VSDVKDHLPQSLRTALGSHGICRQWATLVVACGLAFATMSPAHADPASTAQVSPFPDMSHIAVWYTQLDPEQFFLPDQPGVWFLTPAGQNCGIWNWGSFGCAGDIPGAPPDVHDIAWFNGNRAVHYGWTAAIQFPPGQAQQTLPPRSYVTYESTTCATMPDNSTYCGHGDFEFLMNQDHTWLKGWDDRLSFVCLSYGTCPA
jgi:hypothetical protein